MTGNGERRRSALKIRALAAMAALILGACGDGANSSSGGPETTAAPAQGGGRVVAGAQAFPFMPNCNRVVSDGKDFLAAGCPGGVSSIDPANGTARWEVKDPTWTAVDGLELAGDVVVASVRVTIPASGLTAREEGRRVVALAEGKKLWETKLHPSSPSLSFAGTAEVVGVVVSGTITVYDTKSGRPRFERVLDKAKCSSQGEKPLIFKDSLLACGERLSLGNGSPMGAFLPTRTAGSRAFANSESGLVVATVADGHSALLRIDGTLVSTIEGVFMGFAGGVAVVERADSAGRSGKVLGINPDGSQRWEQAVTFDVARAFYLNVSFANGAAWVRNTSNELVSIDGTTGRPSEPLRVTVGLNQAVDVLATTTKVIVVSSGDGDGVSSLRAIAR